MKKLLLLLTLIPALVHGQIIYSYQHWADGGQFDRRILIPQDTLDHRTHLVLMNGTLLALGTDGYYHAVGSGAAQIQTDWNATTGLGVLLNKPNLSAVALSGAMVDISGTLPWSRVDGFSIGITRRRGPVTLTDGVLDVPNYTLDADDSTAALRMALEDTTTILKALIAAGGGGIDSSLMETKYGSDTAKKAIRLSIAAKADTTGGVIRRADTVGKWVNLIANNATNDSIIWYVGNTRHAIKDNGSGSLQTTANGVTDSNHVALLGGSIYKPTTIDLSTYNKKLWIKLATKTTSDTAITSQLVIGNIDTGSYKIPELRNSALLITKTQATNNGNVDWLAMTTSDGAGPNGIVFRGFSQSNGLTQPQMAVYNADPTNSNGNPAFSINAYRKFTGLGNNFGYTLNLKNIDSALAGAANTAIRGANIFVIDNGEENALFIDSNYNVKIGPTAFFNYPRARLDIHNNGKAWGIYQEGATSKNLLESKLIVGGTFPETDTLNKFTVKGTAKITDTLTNITLGNSDSSNRVPSTAWVKRQGFGSSSGSSAPQTQIMGLAYALNTGSTLSDFKDSSSNATVSGRTISFGAGDNNLFQKSLDLPNPITSTKWIAIDTEIVATITSTSFGRGPGLRSVNRIGGGAFGFAMNVDLSSGAHAGQIGFWSLGGSGLVNLSYTANAMAFTAGDTVIRILRRDMLTFYATVYNKTQRTLPITSSYTFASSDISKTAPNIGRPCIYNLGDAGSVIGWSFVNQETKGAPLAIVSDSRAFYYPSTNSSRWPVILDNYFHPTAVFAGPGDRATEAIAAFSEVLTARPVNTLIMFSTNDFNSGQNVTTVMNNYRTMIAALRGVGSNPFVMCPPYQGVNTGKQDSVRKLNDSIISNFPDSIVIRGAYEAIRQNPGYYLQPDSVHFLDPGDSLLAAIILSSGKIKTGYTTPYVIPDNGYVKAQTTVAQPVSYLISGVGTAGGFSTTLGTYVGTSGLAAQFTANGTVKAFSNGSTSIGFYSAPLFNDNGKSPVAHYSAYFASATMRCDSNFLLNGQLSSTRPIITTSSTSSTLGNTALSYLTLGSLTAASGNGSLIRSTSTLVAAANGDYLIGNMSAPTFTLGAFTGVKQFAYYGNAGNQYFNNHTMLGSSDVDNGADVLQVTGTGKFTGLVKYAANLGSTFDSRTHIDKGYADSVAALKKDKADSVSPSGYVTVANKNKLADSLAALISASGIFTVQGGDMSAQTAALSNIFSYTVPSDGTYEAGGYITVTAVATNVVDFIVNWTDQNNVSRTQALYPPGMTSANLSTTGFYPYSPVTIRAKSGTTISYSTGVVGAGSITYDIGIATKKIR